MSDIKLEIDGKKVTGHEGMTILEVAEQEGIHIPTLCHSPDLIPAGVCRVCVVELAGAKTLVGSCHTKITKGMVVRTHTPEVTAVRRTIIELLMTAHTGTCVNDINVDSCELHKLASDLEVGQPRFQVREPRYYPLEIQLPHIQRDLSKCILCRRCLGACNEIAKKGVLSVGYRGFQSKIITGLDESLKQEVCLDCSVCADYCPTGALSKPQSDQL